MKALTILQPWATLVAIGAKKIETRSWPTKYRGPLAIHASKSFPSYAKVLVYANPVFRGALIRDGVLVDMPLGAILAICNLEDVQKIKDNNLPPRESPERAFGDYRLGRFMWILENVVRLDAPISAKGARRLWEWEDKNHDRT